MDSKLASLIERLEKVTTKLEGLQGGSAPAVQEPGVVTPSLTAFDDIIQGPVKEFLDLSRKTGGLVLDQALCFEKAIQATRQLIATASVSKKPDDKTLQELIKPLQTEMMNITAIKDKNRPAPVFSQLSAVADGSPALGWVVVSPTPGPYINDMKDAAQFYANRVIKENKEKDPSQLVWIQAFLTVLTELFGYVKKYHTTGLSWNAKGGDAKSAPAASAPVATPAPSAGGPPPPPAPTAAQLEAFSGDKKPAAANLLGELSKGTSGLRKVDKSEMTHKNPELRAGSVVKAVEKPVAVPKATATKGPPKLALEGNKWVVENHVGNNEVVIDGVELRHVVYIYNCHNSTIKINGKVNAVTIDGCKKVGVLVDNIVSTIDTVNSQRVQIQITGKCPTAVVDKTDGYQLYLSKECEDLQFLSAKSSEMNLLILNAQGEYVELPVSEQFKTVVKGGKLVTEAVEHKE